MQVKLHQLAGLVPTGPTDPIAHYRRPLIGRLFCERLNLGLRMISDRRYARALEVGYGAGAVLLAMSDSVDDLHGIDRDADPSAIEAWLSSHRRSARLMRGSVYQLPYDGEEFDLVVSFSVFEHLHCYEQGLREVARVLKPGGHFLLGMPAVNILMELGFRSIGHQGIHRHHVSAPRVVARAFDRAGLRVIRQARMRLMPGVALYFNWLLEKSG